MALGGTWANSRPYEIVSYVPDGWRCVEARRRHSGDEHIGARILRDRAADFWQIVVVERRVDVREPCCKIAQDLFSPVEALEAALSSRGTLRSALCNITQGNITAKLRSAQRHQHGSPVPPAMTGISTTLPGATPFTRRTVGTSTTARVRAVRRKITSIRVPFSEQRDSLAHSPPFPSGNPCAIRCPWFR